MQSKPSKKQKPCDVQVDEWKCSNLARNYNRQCYPHREDMQKYGEYRVYVSKRRHPSAVTARDAHGNKHCPKCDSWKPETEFYSCGHTSDFLQPTCKDCYASGNMFRRFSITPELYDSMLRAQSGLCAICKIKSDRRLGVDHDHACCPGENTCGNCIRALLCGQCNTALGMVRESRDILLAMLDYIDKQEDSPL